MSIVDLEHVSKRFGSVQAVDDVTFGVQRGEFFGLLGPNGAGKTTIIRMMLDIFKPDRGKITILGGAMNEEKKNRIGYMPEERGLYQDVPLERALTYLASLKDIDKSEIKTRMDDYLERFELAPHRRKKVKELSKGMQQKAQIIATILHRPELLIIDEPFSGLDPVNTQMIKDLLHDLHRQGTTIIMSTHQMHQVEELCERLVLVNRGAIMLYGSLADVRRPFTGHAVLVHTTEALPTLPGVVTMQPINGTTRLDLSENTTPQMILQALMERNLTVQQFEVAVPTLDEIFIRVVKQQAPVA